MCYNLKGENKRTKEMKEGKGKLWHRERLMTGITNNIEHAVTQHVRVYRWYISFCNGVSILKCN